MKKCFVFVQGESTVYYASGKVEKRSYVKGELNGPATITWPSGDVFEFSYNAGKMEVRRALNSDLGDSNINFREQELSTPTLE